MSLHEDTEIVILGAGIAGLCCAYFLRQHGFRVCIIERDRCGSGSSDAAGGILFPLTPWLYRPALVAEIIASNQLLPGFAQDLQQSTGIDPQCIRSDLCFLDSNPLDQLISSLKAQSVLMDLLSQAELISKNPGIGTQFSQGLLISNVHQVNPVLLIAALFQHVKNQGITLAEGCTALTIKAKPHNQYTVVTSKGSVRCQHLIVALGAWSQTFLEKCGLQAPQVFPVKGQMLEFKPRTRLLNTLLVHKGYYLIPRTDGSVVAGSTLEQTGFDNSITNPACEEITQHAIEALPGLKACAVIRQWAGLRPGSINNEPTVGAHSQLSNMWLNYGHHRYGFALALQSAQKIAEDIMTHCG